MHHFASLPKRPGPTPESIARNAPVDPTPPAERLVTDPASIPDGYDLSTGIRYSPEGQPLSPRTGRPLYGAAARYLGRELTPEEKAVHSHAQRFNGPVMRAIKAEERGEDPAEFQPRGEVDPDFPFRPAHEIIAEAENAPGVPWDGYRPAPPPARFTYRKHGWRTTFLAELARHANESKAREVAQVAYSTVYNARRRDPVFRQRYEEALTMAVQRMEYLLWQAAHGYEKPIYYKGEEIGTEVVHDMKAMEVWLKAHAPDKYDSQLRAASVQAQSMHDLADFRREQLASVDDRMLRLLPGGSGDIVDAELIEPDAVPLTDADVEQGAEMPAVEDG